SAAEPALRRAQAEAYAAASRAAHFHSRPRHQRLPEAALPALKQWPAAGNSQRAPRQRWSAETTVRAPWSRRSIVVSTRSARRASDLHRGLGTTSWFRRGVPASPVAQRPQPRSSGTGLGSCRGTTTSVLGDSSL